MNWVYVGLVGLAAGFLAGLIMKGRGFGFIGNLVVGIVGAILGGWLFGVLGLSKWLPEGLVGSLVTAVAGAVVLLFLIGLVFKKK
ncbi:MAG: GlsB/YeaQ/YmgE family stress response membrane protein [Desulfovibrio sp.]|nr:MAG: GlsB/YeaQ/YmgE family stress response membrane protein [Desulfovibrio sp.]